MFRVNNKDTRTTSGVYIVSFEQICTPCSSVSIVNIEQVNADWVLPFKVPASAQYST